MQKVKRIGWIILSLLLFQTLTAFAGPVDDAIKAVVKSAYIEGIHIERDTDKIKAGFHPDFTMSVLRDDKIVKVSLTDWVSRIEEGKKKNPNPPKKDVKYDFTLVDFNGNAAVARVELYKDGKHVFTDYLSLYQFEDGWKIVAKIFQRH